MNMTKASNGWPRHRLGPWTRGAAVCTVVIVAGAGVAAATIPTNNLIDGCYAKSGGTLRVID